MAKCLMFQYIHTYIHTYMHACIYAYIHTYVYAQEEIIIDGKVFDVARWQRDMELRVRYTCVCMFVCVFMFVCIYMQTYIRQDAI